MDLTAELEVCSQAEQATSHDSKSLRTIPDDGDPSLPPVFRLSSDILWHIFSLASRTTDMFCPNPLTDTRHASQVCQLWREIILESPSIWANALHVREFKQKSDDWRNLVMKRTQDAPLSIMGSVDVDYVAQMLLPVLKNAWPRIRVLRLDIPNIHLSKGEDADESWNVFLQPAPRLEHFEISLRHPTIPLIFKKADSVLFSDQAPALTVFHSRFISFSPTAPWLSHIRNLTICPLMHRSLLKSFTSSSAQFIFLEKLTLTGNHDWTPPHHPMPHLILPHLRDLTLDRFPLAFAINLLQSMAPAPRCALVLKPTDDDVIPSDNSIEVFSLYAHLSLSAVGPRLYEALFRAFPPGRGPGLETLELTMAIGSFNWNVPVLMPPESWRRVPGPLLMPSESYIFPYLRTLSIMMFPFGHAIDILRRINPKAGCALQLITGNAIAGDIPSAQKLLLHHAFYYPREHESRRRLIYVGISSFRVCVDGPEIPSSASRFPLPKPFHLGVSGHLSDDHDRVEHHTALYDTLARHILANIATLEVDLWPSAGNGRSMPVNHQELFFAISCIHTCETDWETMELLSKEAIQPSFPYLTRVTKLQVKAKAWIQSPQTRPTILKEFLEKRKELGVPIKILDLTLCRPMDLGNLGDFEVCQGLRVRWNHGNGAQDMEYICGSGHPELIDFAQTIS